MGIIRSMGLIRIMAILAALAVAAPALAHRLVIYAFVEDDVIVLESHFSNGAPAAKGSITVKDGAGELLVEMPLSETGETRFAIPEGGAEGVAIEVLTDAGHEDYWILTPEDLQ